MKMNKIWTEEIEHVNTDVSQQIIENILVESSFANRTYLTLEPLCSFFELVHFGLEV